ncbi:MAG: YebC/PmpR family DNA-binding transcriptional regulator [Chlamydia sp.]
MAGHSKWANIKHRKEKADSKKGKIFSRASKEIINAVKAHGPDPKSNHKLKIAIQKAKEANFPSDNIERVIKKASSAGQKSYHEIQYELYGHGGVGILVEIMTDNKNRTASDIRIATNKRGGTIAVPGAVSFNFEEKGIITIPIASMNEEQLLEMIANIEGVEDFIIEEDLYIISTNPIYLYEIQEIFHKTGITTQSTEIAFIPKTSLNVSDDIIEANLALIEWLEGIDDVEQVFHNMNIYK